MSGVIDVAAVLALGPAAGAAVAVVSGLVYLELNALRRRHLTRRHLIELPLFNAGLKGLMALLGGALYLWLNGPLPLTRLDARTGISTAAVCLVWFVLDHLAWGFWDYLDGGLERLRLFVRDAIPRALLIELLPLPFSVVVALVYTRLDWPAFALLAVVIVLFSALAQRWAGARNELVQRVAELSTIEQVGRAVAQAQLDVDELCMLMYEHASEIVDTTIFHLGLFDGDAYTLKLWMQEGKPEPPRTFHLAPGTGLPNWLRESRQPILIRDFPKEMHLLPARPAYVSDIPPLSVLYVPLISGETVIGTLSIQSFLRNAYGDSDLRVLSAMANQAAVAIQKARLFAQERKRVRQLEAISQVSRQVSAVLELDELFREMVHLIRDSFGYYHVAIYIADRERQTVTFQASASAGQQNVAFEVEWGQGLIGWAAAHAKPVTTNDVEKDTRYRRIDALEETRSELAVPLLLAPTREAGVAEGELVGVLDVQSDQLDAFGPDDLFILETLGDQVAIAIQEARLYEAERQQAWLSTALLQVADAMSNVSDMDAVLTTIVRLTPILAGVDRSAILLWEAGSETFIPAQAHGLAPELRETFEHMLFPPGTMPALDLIRWDKSPLLVNVARDGLLIPAPLADTLDIHQVLLLPLLAQGELLGVMMVDYAGRPHPFSERLIDMLTGIANQAAMIIQSARLVQAQQEEAYVSMALLQVADAVSRSSELAETLATVTRITPMLVGVEACAILLWNPEAGVFLPSQQYGLRQEARTAFSQLRLTEGDPLVRRLVTGEPSVAFQDIVEDTMLSSVFDKSSLLALPLVARGEVVGIMSVDYSGPPHGFTQRWRNFLTGIAGQAAIAVENDRLLREAAEQERIKQELEVAQRIQTSFLPERCPYLPGWDLAVIWRPARQVGGDFYDFIPLPSDMIQSGHTQGCMGLVIADVADKGVPAALFMALSRTLVRTMAIGGSPPATAVARANDLILSDARSDLFVTLFYVILPPESGRIAFVNAGHMPPLLVRAADGTAEELRKHGMALGVLSGLQFEEQAADLAPGDTLILYTDGVVEACDAEQHMFGRGRLLEMACAHRTESAEELAGTINDAVAAFVGGTPQFDDFTLVVAKRSPA
jgi:serine phosphatase RsbU (regulator of sigma subunit)/putative methionine-R-sulfoxide reductase with GAF domain